MFTNVLHATFERAVTHILKLLLLPESISQNIKAKSDQIRLINNLLNFSFSLRCRNDFAQDYTRIIYGQHIIRIPSDTSSRTFNQFAWYFGCSEIQPISRMLIPDFRPLPPPRLLLDSSLHRTKRKLCTGNATPPDMQINPTVSNDLSTERNSFKCISILFRLNGPTHYLKHFWMCVRTHIVLLISSGAYVSSAGETDIFCATWPIL